jgi:hypothetical protein
MLQLLLHLHSLQSLIALFPLNCMANVREQGAEMTFCFGGKIAQCHRNDRSAADGSAHTTAGQLAHIAAAVVAYVFMFWAVDGIHYSPKWISSQAQF